MPTPNAFKVTVTEIYEATSEVSATATGFRDGHIVFSQTIPQTDFEMQSFVLAVNKRKRNRKARGKEVAS